MEFLNSVGDAIILASLDLWGKVVDFLPELIAAIVILIVGILVARAIDQLVRQLAKSARLDEIVRKIEIIQKIEQSGTRVSFSKILGWLVKWFFYIVILIAVSDILELSQFTAFLNDIALYLPNVIIAALILVVGLVLGQFVDDVIVKVLRGTKAKKAPFIGAVSRWAIIIFALLAALIQLNVAVALINTLFTAVVVTLALGTGLAFGLGGKDAARDAIEKFKRDINQ